MKTKLIALALIIAAIMMFAGCDTSAVNSTTETSNKTNLETTMPKRMEYLFKDRCHGVDYFYYYRDVYTDIVYVFAYRSDGYGGGGSFTSLLNADGTPVLWSEIESEMETTK